MTVHQGRDAALCHARAVLLITCPPPSLPGAVARLRASIARIVRRVVVVIGDIAEELPRDLSGLRMAIVDVASPILELKPVHTNGARGRRYGCLRQQLEATNVHRLVRLHHAVECCRREEGLASGRRRSAVHVRAR